MSLPPSKSSTFTSCAGSNRRKLPFSARCESSAICPEISTPVGPPPTTTKVSQRLARLVVLLELGLLESAEDPLALRERVRERLHPGRELGELVVSEVRLPDARPDDEAVVGKRQHLPVRANGGDLLRCDVDRGHVGQLHGRVLLALQDVASRRSDLSRREDPGRDLVQQRLEEMVVRPVDQRQLDRRVAEKPGREKSAESGADDHDSVRDGARHRVPPLERTKRSRALRHPGGMRSALTPERHVLVRRCLSTRSASRRCSACSPARTPDQRASRRVAGRAVGEAARGEGEGRLGPDDGVPLAVGRRERPMPSREVLICHEPATAPRVARRFCARNHDAYERERRAFMNDPQLEGRDVVTVLRRPPERDAVPEPRVAFPGQPLDATFCGTGVSGVGETSTSSSSTIVPVAVVFASVVFCGLESATVNVSFGSVARSPTTLIAIAFVSSPGLNVTVPLVREVVGRSNGGPVTCRVGDRDGLRRRSGERDREGEGRRAVVPLIRGHVADRHRRQRRRLHTEQGNPRGRLAGRPDCQGHLDRPCPRRSPGPGT